MVALQQIPGNVGDPFKLKGEKLNFFLKNAITTIKNNFLTNFVLEPSAFQPIVKHERKCSRKNAFLEYIKNNVLTKITPWKPLV